MTSAHEAEISRRAALKYAGMTAGIGVIAAFASPLLDRKSAAATELTPSEDKKSEAANLAFSSTGDTQFTDLAGIHAEYLATIAVFPLALPRGVVFPASSRLTDPIPNALWERGNGTGEAYFFWHQATLSALEEAQARGDVAEAERLLKALEDGCASPIRKQVWDLPGGALSDSFDQARRGNLAPLRQLTS